MITFDGFVAGERVRRDRMLIGDGTPDGVSHWRLIRALLSKVFRASGITQQMPDKCPDTPVTTASEEHQETGQLLVFLAEPADADCGKEFFYRRN